MCGFFAEVEVPLGFFVIVEWFDGEGCFFFLVIYDSVGDDFVAVVEWFGGDLWGVVPSDGGVHFEFVIEALGEGFCNFVIVVLGCGDCFFAFFCCDVDFQCAVVMLRDVHSSPCWFL